IVADSRIEGGQPSDKVGCIRNFNLKAGGNIREQLLSLSDYDYTCSYAILESPMGVRGYTASLKLTPITDGDRTFAEWTAAFHCHPAREQELGHQTGTGVFQAGFAPLKRQAGRRCPGAWSRSSAARSSMRPSTRCGRSCATSTRTTSGIRRWPKAASR